MHIGLLLGGLTDAPTLGAIAARAEALGFDSLWAGDHVAFPAPIVDPLQLLACFASHTRRIGLGTCVYLLALRHPTVVAKMVASLDFISGGRVTFGVGVGGEFPDEFAACGVAVGERGARTNEAIAVLRNLWQVRPADHNGRFFQVRAVRLQPVPAQSGGPPIWVGGRADAALRRAARLGDGYVGYLLTPDGFRERMARLGEMAARAGRGDRPLTGALMAFALVADDRDAALRRAGQVLGAMYGRRMDNAAARYCIAGGPADCRAQVEDYARAGVEHLILSPLVSPAETHEQMGMLAAALNLAGRGTV